MTTMLVRRAAQKLADLEIENGGRWTNITLKKTGEVLTLIRLGYGPMERPQGDNHQLKDSHGNILINSESLEKIASYICNL